MPTFFGGLADIFITCMIWFVLDDKGTPDIFMHGAYSYPVLNVVKEEGSVLVNDDANDGEEEPTVNLSINDNRNTLISDRMI